MFTPSTILLAQNTYTPLQSLPGLTSSVATNNLSSYLNTLYSLGLGIAAGLAVIMILIGGIQYLSTDAISGKEEGKERITSALWGLLLSLCSWIILNTIDPGLLNTNILVNPVTLQGQNTSSIPSYNSGTGSAYSSNSGNYSSNSGYLSNSSSGYSMTFTSTGEVIMTNNIAIDTDGTQPPPFVDADSTAGPGYQSETSLPGLNANTDPYIVVPTNSNIPLGTPVVITDNTTGLSVNAVVGDHGPAYGEISTAAAQAIGAWSPGMGNSANSGNLTITIK